MTKPHYMGLGTSQRSLVVYVDIENNGVKRAAEVRVPWSDLTRDEILYDIHTAVAKRLRDTWEAETPPWDRDLPLPGIG